jgi:hypothetical protein
MRTMTLTKLSFVVFLAATALPRLTSVHAQQPQARRPAAAPQADLTGRWRFSSFGSSWTVDLKLDPSKTTVDEKAYCGDAVRDQLVPDTPIIKARLCAAIDADDGQLLMEVQSVTCRAPWRSTGMLDGTCTKGGGMATSMKMDDATADSMPPPMGGFTAIRIAAETKK